MAEYKANPFLKMDPYNQEPQHIGEAAGGSGTMGLQNNGAAHRQAPDPTGCFGPDVQNGLVPGAAQSLIARSTGVKVNDGRNGDLYGKKGVY